RSPAPASSVTLSLHDALPICLRALEGAPDGAYDAAAGEVLLVALGVVHGLAADPGAAGELGLGEPKCGASAGELRSGGFARFRRSEEHTSELQSRENLVCRLL